MTKRGEARMVRTMPAQGVYHRAAALDPVARSLRPTLLSREYALITAHRTNIPAYGYNLMPMLSGVNVTKFHRDSPQSYPAKHNRLPLRGIHARCNGEPPSGQRSPTWTATKRRCIAVRMRVRRGTKFLAHKDKMIKLLGPDDDDIPGMSAAISLTTLPITPATTGAEHPDHPIP